jgi:glycosyltransferase involved in cell wall biosynthesis
MRIAYITDTYLPETNGIVTAIVHHSRGLASRGHEFLICCPEYGADDPGSSNDIRIHRFPAHSARSNAETHVAVPPYRTLTRLLKDFAPDLVHVHTPLPIGVTGIVVARRLGIPLVHTYHSYMPGFLQYASPLRLLGIDRRPHHKDVSRLAWFLTRLVLNPSNLVLAPSRAMCAGLERHGVTAPVSYQTNGIDRVEFPPKTDWSLRQRIVHTGRLGYEKNADVVVEAFARFAAGRPGWELHLLGEGPAEAHLRGLIDRLGIGDRVRFEGFVSRTYLAESYRTGDIYATASTIETQGLVVLGAMASGTPVVGVDALAVPEMARHGEHGLIVRPYDPDAMAQAFATLADDDALRERMGRACIKGAAEHDLDVAIALLEEHYTGCSAGLYRRHMRASTKRTPDRRD